MGKSYESASSILLCAEDKSSILTFDGEEEAEGHYSGWEIEPKSCLSYGDFFKNFPLLPDECLNLLLTREAEHLPREDYAKRLMCGQLEWSIRRDAIDWILKVHAYYKFGPSSAFLSINYLDRFLSCYELPQGKAWMTQLLSVACLSLASKMEETEVPLLIDLQAGEAKFVFESRTIQRMELLVLSTLNWRMQAVTPFSFVYSFLYKLNNGDSLPKVLTGRAVELILCTTRGIDFLAFLPSEIAAAAAMSAISENRSVDFRGKITWCSEVDQGRVYRCYEMLQEEMLTDRENPIDGIPSVACVPQSPNGVLDAARLSYKSDEMTSDSQPIQYYSSPAAKRRKTTI
ncbi:hypothetical protein HPP92_012712 [Vanilla planifolia]|uniref:Cyclin N-terminal domain-containing protein n=1 Tax=Vanilla planifolia TaxID=51239 RepID=A0A835QX19_VANPL|nr:hypothetical protein HPP92_013138 [Vanilla planifolia]KAG0477993.1 hypothetical protein HPP92_012712 [Vanilla planifolia]